jgi:hypothetical protein
VEINIPSLSFAFIGLTIPTVLHLKYDFHCFFALHRAHPRPFFLNDTTIKISILLYCKHEEGIGLSDKFHKEHTPYYFDYYVMMPRTIRKLKNNCGQIALHSGRSNFCDLHY